MQQTRPLTPNLILRFVNKHRAELRPMPLSHELHKLLFLKSALSNEAIYEITQQLLIAEKGANSKQKNLFKNLDNELSIPYQQAKKLHQEGKLNLSSFKQLLSAEGKVDKKIKNKQIEK